MSQRNNFKSFNHQSRWYNIFFLTVLLTFSNLIISPVFAEETLTNPDSTSIQKESDENALESTNSQAEDLDSDSYYEPYKHIVVYYLDTAANYLSGVKQGVSKEFSEVEEGISQLANKGYNVTLVTIHYALERLSKDEKKSIADTFSNPKTGEFAANYIDGYRPLVLTETAKKTISRGARAYIYTGNLGSAYSLTDSSIFAKRSFIELVRNFSPMVKKASAKGDYIKAGQIIRTSLVAHFFVWPLQVGAGFAVSPIFKNFAGDPATQRACDYVGFYSRWSSLGAPLTEFSGMTGEDLLALQAPEQQLTYSIFNGLPLALYLLSGKVLQYFNIPQDEYLSLGIYITSEFAINAINTARLYNILANNPKYAPYQIFNTSNGPLIDCEALQGLYSYSTFKSTLATTSTGIAQRLINSLYGNNALRIGGTLDKIGLVINPFVVGGAKDSKQLVTTARANNATEADIKQIMSNGLSINTAISALYLIPVIAPGLVANNPDALTRTLIRISGFGSFVEGIERAANEEQAAFKKDEQGWLKTFGDYSKYASVGFLLFFKFCPGQRNQANYLLYRAITILPPLLNIGSVVKYIWDTSPSSTNGEKK